MNKKALATFLMFATAMIVLPISTVFAANPMIEVSGNIKSGLAPGASPVVTTAGANIFTYIETASNWTGSIVGRTLGSQIQARHIGGTEKTNHTTINAEIFFWTATFEGKTGTMTVLLYLNMWQGVPEKTHGTWLIQNATGGLAGLQGGGEWIVGAGINQYVGTVHWT